MACCTRTLAKNGFKLGVCEDFMERVEKTVLSVEIPEQKMDLIKTDDSVDNLVVGFVQDVTYVLTIPAVVKREKGEDDDDEDELMIVGVTPATMDPPLIQEVKKEPTLRQWNMCLQGSSVSSQSMQVHLGIHPVSSTVYCPFPCELLTYVDT